MAVTKPHQSAVAGEVGKGQQHRLSTARHLVYLQWSVFIIINMHVYTHVGLVHREASIFLSGLPKSMYF